MVAQNTICEPCSFHGKELEDQKFDYLTQAYWGKFS